MQHSVRTLDISAANKVSHAKPKMEHVEIDRGRERERRGKKGVDEMAYQLNSSEVIFCPSFIPFC